MATRFFDEFIKQFIDSLPPSLKHLRSEFESHLRQSCLTAVNKLDLVTRQEFDVQLQVLARTRAKLELLENKVASLENQNS